MKNKIYIGIDPGVKTGLAVWYSSTGRLTKVCSLGIINAMDYVKVCQQAYKDDEMIVRIENPNLRQWYGNKANLKKQGAGSIKRDFSIWIEFFKLYGIRYEEVNPQHVMTKSSAAVFAGLTGWKGKTNEHSRDAAMLVYGK